MNIKIALDLKYRSRLISTSNFFVRWESEFFQAKTVKKKMRIPITCLESRHSFSRRKYLDTHKWLAEGESKVMSFFNTGIITDTRTCIIHLSLSPVNHIPISLNSNVSPPSKESMYRCLVKFCWLFFEPRHHCSFHFLVTGVIFDSYILF